MTSPAASPDPEPRAWRPTDAAIVLACWFVAGVVGAIIVGVDAVPTTRETFGVIVPMQSLAAVGSVAVLARTRTDWRQALAVRIAWADSVGVLIGAGLEVALAIALVSVVQGLFHGSIPQQEVVGAASGAVGVADEIVVVVALVVLGPVAEELIFRGVLLRTLLARHDRRTAVWWSAAAFAGLHLLDPSAAPVTPLLLVLGVVMGNQAVSTGRLGRSVAIHAGFNLVTVAALFTLR